MSKLKRIVIKEELVALCDGNFNEAMVLSQLLFWQETINDSDNEIRQKIERKKKLDLPTASDEKSLRHGWFWKTSEELAEELMKFKSRQVIDRVLKALIEKEFVEDKERIRGRWDNTKGYRVKIDYIRQELQKLGYTLEGYPLPNSETPSSRDAQNERTADQNEHTYAQNEHTADQNEQTVSVSNISNQQSISNAVSIYQSKKEEISKIELPPKVELVCHKLIDRLIDDNINIGDIKAQFNTYKLLIKHESEEEYQDFFATYLERVLYATKGTIRSIKSLIDTAIKKDFQEGSITVYKNPNAKQEVLPEWFKKQKQQENPEQDNQESSLENEKSEDDPDKLQQEKDEILKSIKARSQKRKQESLT